MVQICARSAGYFYTQKRQITLNVIKIRQYKFRYDNIH